MNTPPSADRLPAAFRRPMAVAELRGDADTRFRISAGPDERADLARYFGVDRIDRLTLAGFIGPAEGGGWRVRGRLVAELVQTCVVSLTPLASRHDAEIERRYLPAAQLESEQKVEVEVSHDEQDLPDPFTDSIDPAQLALESLALMIDPYPRAGTAELGQRNFAAPGITPLSDEASLPFAGLAVLKPGRNEGKG